MMSKTQTYVVCGAVIVIGAIIAYFSFNKTTIRNLNSSGSSIVAFGDSLVQGFGSTPGHDIFSILGARIGEPIINLGVSGDTTAQAIGRIQEVLDKNPRLVIIILGGNDYIRRVPVETTFENLGKIVDTIQAQGSAVLILGVRGGLLKDTYEGRFESFAKSHQTGYVPNILDGLIGDSRYMSDAVHPNDVGYKMIADKVEPILKEMLK